MTLDELDMLAEKATQRPWISNFTKCGRPEKCNFADPGMCSMCLPVGIWGNQQRIGDTTFTASVGVAFPGQYGCREADEKFRNNAAFVTALANTYPALRALIRAADALASQPGHPRAREEYKRAREGL